MVASHQYGILIFYSFNQLNSRFNALIRDIPLYLDCQNVYKLLFDQFCKKMLSNEEIKKQIYSLNLSNKYLKDQIQQFLSFFPLNKFPYLRSLILTQVKQNDILQLKLMLPIISQLSYVRLIDARVEIREILNALPTIQLRTSETQSMNDNLTFMNKFSSLTKLTISTCSSTALNLFLKRECKLKYLKIKNVSGSRFLTMSKNEYLPKSSC